MTLGLAGTEASALLSAQFQGVAYAAGGCWLVPHLGDPGAAGTSNAAAMTTRADGGSAFGTAPVIGSGSVTITNDAVIGATEWVNPPASETWTHMSRWSAPTGGTFLGSGLITPKSVTAGTPASLGIGDVTATYNTAA